MFLKSFLFLFGFGLSVISLTYILIYLNLLSIGYSFSMYIMFIVKRIECLNLLVGIVIIYISLLIGGKDELYI